MKINRKVSVILCAHNAEQFISKAIDSVLNQTYSNFELFIINDGSDDNTLEIINSFGIKDSRITIVNHSNIGKGESINQVVFNSITTEYIFHMDADDIMLPERIQKQLIFIEKTALDATSCLAYYIDATDKIIGKTYNDLDSFTKFNEYLKKNEPIGLLNPGFVIRKDKFLAIGGYRGKYWPADDIDLYNRLTEIGCKILTQQEILMKYRIHGGSVITSKFVDSRKKYEWVRASMWSRRIGVPEPTWEEYLKSLDNKTILGKLNWRRKVYAKNYYRSAGFDFAKKEIIPFILHLLTALILQPTYVMKKIFKQFI